MGIVNDVAAVALQLQTEQNPEHGRSGSSIKRCDQCNALDAEFQESNSATPRAFRVLARTVDDAGRPIPNEDWLAYRRMGIGGSDAPIISGHNRWSSLTELYATELGIAPPQDENLAMKLGHKWEQDVADLFTEATGKKAHKRNAILQSVEHPCMLANVDRLIVGERAGLECKTTAFRYEWDEGIVPDYYVVQCQHYMAVTGYPLWYLAVLVNDGFGPKFHHYEVYRNEETIAGLIEAEEYFWTHNVCAHVPPEPDGSRSSGSTIRYMYKGNPDIEPVSLDEYEADLDEYFRLKSEADDLSKRADAIKQKVMQAMGDATEATVGRYKPTWKPQTSRRLDTRRLKSEQPDTYDAYANETTTRIFRVSQPKEA